jgi:hypothetical protein
MLEDTLADMFIHPLRPLHFLPPLAHSSLPIPSSVEIHALCFLLNWIYYLCFTPGRSRQNAQWFWSGPLTEIMAVGCVWAITGSKFEYVTHPSSRSTTATTASLFLTCLTSKLGPRTTTSPPDCYFAVRHTKSIHFKILPFCIYLLILAVSVNVSTIYILNTATYDWINHQIH